MISIYHFFVIVNESGKPVGPIVNGDIVVTLNFWANRMVMIAKYLQYENFEKFYRVCVLKSLVCWNASISLSHDKEEEGKIEVVWG